MFDPTNINEIIGRNVQNIRIEKGISEKEFAKLFGVSLKKIRELEKGKKDGFNVFDMPKLMEILNIEREEIMNGIKIVKY